MRAKILICFLLVAAGTLNAQQISIRSIEEVKPLKRGKVYQVSWTGGTTSEKVKITLSKNRLPVKTWEDLPNSGFYNVRLPRNLKPGNDYEFEFAQGTQIISTQELKIKRKSSLGVKIGVFATLATAVMLFGPPYGNGAGLAEPPSPSGN